MTSSEQKLAVRAMAAGDYEEAARLLRPLSDDGSEYALLSLGWMYENGKVGARDNDVARSYYERAAITGSADAHLYLGHLLSSMGDMKKARETYKIGQKLGSVECREALDRLVDVDTEKKAAIMLEAGDYRKAVDILKPLADEGSQYALMSLGWIYETGAIGDPDVEAARVSYERAVESGSAAASFDLGRLLSGQGNDVKARLAFEVGAERNDIACMARLGRMMVEGRGGPADTSAGMTWLERAASAGHIHAQRTILGIKEGNAKSVFERLSIKREIAALAAKGASEAARNPHSDKIR
ncbi:MAG: tetratricopeptide repeat protein [Pseudomonadota bacterium]|jgi:TPR repeat protein